MIPFWCPLTFDALHREGCGQDSPASIVAHPSHNNPANAELLARPPLRVAP